MNLLLQVYVHIDMDAYYAQAEQKLLSIPEDKPVCARQWNSLIAINYPARAAGIKRGMLAEEAIKLCPDVLLPHVETFKLVDGKVVFSSTADKYTQHNQYEEKVSLRYYRTESKQIFSIIKMFCRTVEKGGTDEGYLQFSEEELNKIDATNFVGEMMSEIPPDYQYTEQDLLLMKASVLTQQIRDAIYKEAKYKCSAGISFNKMLSKLASATNKPNKQTVILECMLPECIAHVKINKIRGFGGKVQETLTDSGFNTVGEAQQLSIHELTSLFAERGQYIYDKLRGYDDEGVKKDVDLKNKSILSLKNIKKTSSREIVEQSLELIVHDITMRVSDFYDDFNLVPSVLVVHYHNVIKGSHQKSEPIHLSLPVESFRLSIEDRVNSILKSLADTELFPLIHIGISCRYFKPMTSGIQNPITVFFDKIAQQAEQEKKAKLVQEYEKLLAPENYYTCHMCGKEILKTEQVEHDDFHYAENLDKAVNPNKRKYKSNSRPIEINQTQKQK